MWVCEGMKLHGCLFEHGDNVFLPIRCGRHDSCFPHCGVIQSLDTAAKKPNKPCFFYHVGRVSFCVSILRLFDCLKEQQLWTQSVLSGSDTVIHSEDFTNNHRNHCKLPSCVSSNHFAPSLLWIAVVTEVHLHHESFLHSSIVKLLLYSPTHSHL